MLVPRELLGSVVGLGFETPDGFNFTGVAYFVSVPAALVPGKVHPTSSPPGTASATVTTSSFASTRPAAEP